MKDKLLNLLIKNNKFKNYFHLIIFHLLKIKEILTSLRRTYKLQVLNLDLKY